MTYYDSDDAPTFQLGLALTGSTTRGAYVAGVVDFLLQALSEWEQQLTLQLSTTSPFSSASSPAPFLPPWRVHLRTIVGCGAGGLTASLATSTLATSTLATSTLRQLWVDAPSASALFNADDLPVDWARVQQRGPPIPIRSLLSSRFLSRRVRKLFTHGAEGKRVPTWAEGMEVYLVGINLRGVPLSKVGGAGKKVFANRHADWLGFKMEAEKKGLVTLRLKKSRASRNWKKLISASIAACVIPPFFPLRNVTTRKEVYEKRTKIAEFDTGGVRPEWSKGMDSRFKFDMMDGSIFCKRPIQVVKKVMQQEGKEKLFHTDAKMTKGCVFLIDPSPKTNNNWYDNKYYSYGGSLFKSIRGLLNAFLNESNFNDEEFCELVDMKNISQFLISPMKQLKPKKDLVLACDSLGGMGGILSKEIREHDFELGRLNCQKFLLEQFVISVEDAIKNPIFGKHALRFQRKCSSNPNKYVVPIIPLVGEAKKKCQQPQWPRYSKKKQQEIRSKLCELIRTRMHRLLSSFAYNLGFYRDGFAFGINSTWNYVVDTILNMSTDRMMIFVNRQIWKALRQFS